MYGPLGGAAAGGAILEAQPTVSEPQPKKRRHDNGTGLDIDSDLDRVPGDGDDQHQHDDDVPGDDAVLGSKEAARIIPRRVRGRQGVRRDKLLQMAISNFTVSYKNTSGVDGSAESADLKK